MFRICSVPFSIDAPAGLRRPVVRLDADDGVPELVELPWGLEPFTPDQKPFRYIRSEGRTFPTHRCLVPASEFHLRSSGRTYRVALRSGDWFYFAGVWRPKTAMWPEAFAIITTEANPDVAPYQDRQGVVIVRGEHCRWLQQPDADERLATLPGNSFDVEEMVRSGRRQRALSF